MLLAFRRVAKQLTVALSIILMLGSLVASGQAKAAHTVGMINNAILPCHHALRADGAMAIAKSPLDLCRDLCLAQAPDTLMAPAGISTTPAVITVLLPVNTYLVAADIPQHPVYDTPVSRTPPRPQPYPASAKRLI